MESAEIPCQELVWDSEFFGRRIARVTTGRLTPDVVPSVTRWAAERRIDCLYYLADAEEPECLAPLTAVGFRRVDVRLTYERAASPLPAVPFPSRDVLIRPARPEDLPDLCRIAAASHRDSRFYADPRFPRAMCDRLYAVWIERRCADPAMTALVAESQQRAVGYLAAYLEPDTLGRIDLIGVDASASRRGIATRLLADTFDRLAGRGARGIVVATQERNATARALYERVGFSLGRHQWWYHWWREHEAAA